MKIAFSRTAMGAIALAAAAAFASNIALAQEYLMPNAPGKAEIADQCQTCHGIIFIFSKGKRSPHQWAEVVHDMVANKGAKLNEEQVKTVLNYLNTNYGQPNDMIPKPPAPPPKRLSYALALEAAQGALDFCHKGGYLLSSTVVVDSAGNPVVLLASDNSSPSPGILMAKAATVVRYKVPSEVIMKRLNNEPALVKEIQDDPKIREVRPGALPIVKGGEFVGAISVAGDTGPPDKDRACSQAGLDKIAAGLK